MRIRTFKGDYFNIGLEQGKIYQKNRINFDDIVINPFLYHQQLLIYHKYYPELLEELKGIAKGGNYPLNKVIYRFIASEIIYFEQKMKNRPACTIFGLKKKKDFFIGRNYDWIPGTEKIFTAYKVINNKTNNFIAVSDMGIDEFKKGNNNSCFYNTDNAINDKGLFISLNFAYINQQSYGLSSFFMIKLIAETCAFVNDALEVFNRVPLCCPKNFFIADKEGNMAVVEHTSKEYAVIYPKNDLLIKTNHYIDNELAKEDMVLKIDPCHTTFLRYYETLKNINLIKDNFKYKDIARILREPKSYTYQDTNKIKTIWTLAIDLNNKKYSMYWDSKKKKYRKNLSF